jgi:hypothetical protein
MTVDQEKLPEMMTEEAAMTISCYDRSYVFREEFLTKNEIVSSTFVMIFLILNKVNFSFVLLFLGII